MATEPLLLLLAAVVAVAVLIGAMVPLRTGRAAPTLPTLADLAQALEAVGGRPGSATEAQRAAVRHIGLGDPKALSAEQASAILSAKAYAEGVVQLRLGTARGYDREREIEARLIALIVNDDALRNRAVAWHRQGYGRGGGAVPPPPRDQHFQRVDAALQRMLTA